MYARTVKGKELTLVVSGMLWEMSLVIQDLETKSLWSHLLGESMKGELVGEKLTVIPSYMTDWKSWKQTYPETTCVVMQKTAHVFNRNFITSGQHFSPLLIGITNNSESRGWHFSDFGSRKVVNDSFGKSKVPVVAIYDSESGTAVVYGRTVDEMTLTFSWKDDTLVDDQTESNWELLTGTATSGKLEGKSLGPQRGIVSFERAWQSFHPESTYWSPKGKENKSGAQ